AEADNSDPLAGIPAPSTFLANATQWLDQLLNLLLEGAGRFADLARSWVARFEDLISYWTARISDLADPWVSRPVPLARSWLHQVNVRVAAIQSVVDDPASGNSAPRYAVSAKSASVVIRVSADPVSADLASNDLASNDPTSNDPVSWLVRPG